MTRITWIDNEGGYGFHDVDMDQARRLTPDGGDLGASVAGMLAQEYLNLAIFADGNGPILRIDDPVELAGRFIVVVTRTRQDASTPDGRVVYLGTGGESLVFDVAPQRLTPEAKVHFAEMHEALMAATPADQVEKAFFFLGNIYGHDIAGSMDDEEDAQIDRLRDMYDEAILHDLGWPVRSKISGDIGFLACAESADGLSDEARRRFKEEHGLTPMLASNWNGQGYDRIVCFVPFHRIEDGRAIAYALGEISPPILGP